MYPNRFHYHQDVHKTQLHNGEQNISSEWQLFAGLHLGWNSTAILSLPVWQDIIKSKGDMTKSLATQVIKTHNLNKIHQKIVNLNIQENVMQGLLDKFHLIKNKEEKTTESHSSIKASFSSNINQPICACKNCKNLLKNITFCKKSFSHLLQQEVILSNFIEGSMEL